MTPEPNAVLLAQGSLGADAEEFMKSELGRTLIGLAKVETRVAMDALKRADPEDAKEIRKFQNNIWLAERFEGWLVQLIMTGRQALIQYDVRTSDQHQDGDDDGQDQGTAIQPGNRQDGDLD